jgi:hypothetical protein
VNHKSGTTAADAQDDSRPADTGTSTDRSELGHPGFGARGRMRRRARFLRKARELAYRDLGGLVFNLHRFGQRNDPLVIGKLTTLGHIDAELRTLESALAEHRPVTVLREAGITACARCAAIHSSEDRFCPNCGLALSRHPDLPIAGAAGSPAAPAPAQAVNASQAPPAPAPAPAPEAPVEGTTPSTGKAAPVESSEPAVAAPSISGASPAPARAPDPAPPPRPRPSRSGTGRSPAPRSTPAASPAAAPAQASSDEEEPTEILHPPPAGP